MNGELKMERTISFIGDAVSTQPQAAYQKMLQAMANKFDTDMVICVCHGRYEVLPQDMDFDKLYIFAQLLPKETDGIRKIDVKGFTLNKEKIEFWNKEGAVDPCPQGKSLTYNKPAPKAVLITDDEGTPIATLHDGYIYIHNDFIHARDKRDLENGMSILEYVLNFAADKTDMLKHLKSGLEDKSKRVLELALSSQFKIRLDKEVVQLKAAKDTVVQYEKGIVEAMRKAISTEKIIEAIRLNIEDVPKALNKTWQSIERMRNSKSYTSISFTKTCLKAITTPITIKFKSQEYKIGRLEVNLYFDGQCKIFNLDHKIDGHYDHPHVTGGSVCWGNFSGWIPKLVGSSEFDVALDQIYTFLCHYDEASPYRKIDGWPLVEKKKEVASKEEPKMEIAS
jgi:uncharacterized protein YaiE (UPF0345 family)